MRASGVLKFFDTQKGYGFIKQDDGGPDVFVHIKDLQRARIDGVKEGDTLLFEIQAGREGRPKASEIERKKAVPFST